MQHTVYPINCVCDAAESLEHYKEALVHHVQAQDELQEVIVAQKQPEMAAKYKECQEAETQLLEVERQLGECHHLRCKTTFLAGVHCIFWPPSCKYIFDHLSHS